MPSFCSGKPKAAAEARKLFSVLSGPYRGQMSCLPLAEEGAESEVTGCQVSRLALKSGAASGARSPGGRLSLVDDVVEGVRPS